MPCLESYINSRNSIIRFLLGQARIDENDGNGKERAIILGTLLSLRPSACTFAVPSQNLANSSRSPGAFYSDHSAKRHAAESTKIGSLFLKMMFYNLLNRQNMAFNILG